MKKGELDSMFHWDQNIYFGRKEDGSVRIVKFAEQPTDWPSVDDRLDDADLDVVVPAAQWCSIVSFVSSRGDNADTFQQAVDFHSRLVR